jgi:Coenzyme PQQ synthesis protein D (PqqD)
MEGEKLRLNKDVVSRRVGDEVVLVQLERDQLFSLNPTGARAWELLSDDQDLGTIEATIANEFGVDREEVRRELDSLVAALERAQLVEKA